MIPFVYNIQNKSVQRDRKQTGGHQGEEKGMKSDCLMGEGFFFFEVIDRYW